MMKKIHELHESTISRLIEQALFEDLGFGDITTECLIPEDTLGTAHIISNENGIVAGLEVAGLVYRYIDMQITFSPIQQDGDTIKPGKTVAHIHGPLRGLLQGKQTAVNFLMRMSGVASLTREYVNEVQGTKTKITGTRHTIPTLRMIDHFALKAGGGFVRSFGADEEIVITAGHVIASGGYVKAIEKVLKFLGREKLDKPVSVEVQTFDDLKEILEHTGQLDRIILSGFPPAVIPQAVDAINGRTEIEATGSYTTENAGEIAQAGVDYIAIPDATHSPKALTFAFRVSL